MAVRNQLHAVNRKTPVNEETKKKKKHIRMPCQCGVSFSLLSFDTKIEYFRLNFISFRIDWNSLTAVEPIATVFVGFRSQNWSAKCRKDFHRQAAHQCRRKTLNKQDISSRCHSNQAIQICGRMLVALVKIFQCVFLICSFSFFDERND